MRVLERFDAPWTRRNGVVSERSESFVQARILLDVVTHNQELYDAAATARAVCFVCRLKEGMSVRRGCLTRGVSIDLRHIYSAAKRTDLMPEV